MGQLASPPSVESVHTRASPSPLLQPPSLPHRVRSPRRVARHLAHLTHLVARLFSRLWRLLRRVWLAIIFGGLVLAIMAQVLITSPAQLADPLRFAAVQAILAHPDLTTAVMAAAIVLVLLASIADRRLRIEGLLKDAYAMEQVDEVSTSTILTTFRIARYVPDVYLRRHLRHHDAAAGQDADLAARIALCAARRREISSEVGPLGICVFGRPTQGKTRLAWEAVRTTLPDALLVTWPYYTPQVTFPYAAVAGRTVVLWLDDLVKYFSGSQTQRLLDLPTRFAKARARLVVVATCRSGHDEFTVRQQLGSLLDRLTPIRPLDMTEAEATALARAFQQTGETVYVRERDMTPGSLLLGVDRMRNDVYPQLPTDAKRVLRAMKLLVSAGIYTYPDHRVRVVASDPDLFGPFESTWRDVTDSVATAGFVRLRRYEQGNVTLEPVADVYLDDSIPDYPSRTIDGASEADDWPKLQRVLTQQRDADALLSLGTAFAERLLGKRRENQQRALTCYRAALSVYTRGGTPANWAGAQNALGNALSDQAEPAKGAERARLLSEAVAAYRAALSVYTREDTPAKWAGAQYNLALVHLQRVLLADDEGEEVSVVVCAELQAAHSCVRGAREVFARTNSPFFQAADALLGQITSALVSAGCSAT